MNNGSSWLSVGFFGVSGGVAFRGLNLWKISLTLPFVSRHLRMQTPTIRTAMSDVITTAHTFNVLCVRMPPPPSPPLIGVVLGRFLVVNDDDDDDDERKEEDAEEPLLAGVEVLCL